MKLLYTSNPFMGKHPDEAYSDEFEAMVSAGLDVVLFSSEDFDAGRFHPRPALGPGSVVLYRGWMLSPDAYGGLQSAVEAGGARLLTSTDAYRRAHYLPEWYSLCSELTPRTVFLGRDADFEAELSPLGWTAYFVKDYVKSLSTGRGSIARAASDVAGIVDEMERYRGCIEGGVCVRQFEDLVPDSEERYFALHGRVYARDETPIPAEVHAVASRIDSPFISIDIARRIDGAVRLIEVGDGQVSDRKKWSASRFAALFANLDARAR